MLQSVIVSPAILILAAISYVVFLGAGLLKRGLRKSLFKKTHDKVSGTGAAIAAASVIQQLALAFIMATALVALVVAAANIWLQQTADNPEQLSVLSKARLAVETGLDSVAQFSLGLWIVSIGVIAAIWMLAASSSSSRKWKKAVAARRAAIEASLAGLGADELRARLVDRHPSNAQQLDQKLDTVRRANLVLAQKARQSPVVELGEPAQGYSIVDLERIRDGARAEAVALSEAIQQRSGQTEAGPSDDFTSDGTDANSTPSIDELQAARLEALRMEESLTRLIDNIDAQIKIPRQTVTGLLTEVALSRSADEAGATEAEITAFVTKSLADLEIASHDAQAARVARTEPELIREWIGTAATSKAAVDGTSLAGRFGGFIAMIALMLGAFGLSAQAAAPQLISAAKVIELDLFAQNDAATLAAALQEREPAAEAPESVEEPLADDDATEAYVRVAFRTAVARDFVSRSTSGQISNATRRELFRAGAADARQSILAASSRDSVPQFDVGAPEQSIRVGSGAAAAAPDAEIAQTLDDAIDRQVRELRKNDTVWRELRRSAARPAQTDYAAEALMKTVFADTGETGSGHPMKVRAQAAAGEFGRQVAAGVAPDAVTLGTAASPDQVPLTLREQRIIADFEADAPNRIAAASERASGSLQRTVPSGAPSGVYEDLFSAAAQASPPGVSGGGGGGAAGQTRTSAAATRVQAQASARSFTRMRMSGKIGGVLIGREPNNSEAMLDVDRIEWERGADGRIRLLVGQRGAALVDLGWFHPAIVHQAMAYAADGRVIAVTMPKPTGSSDTSAFSFPGRRIVVHPAFEDTAFACPATEIDTFVDAFMFGPGEADEIGRAEIARTAVDNFGQLLGLTSQVPEYERLAYLDELEAEAPPGFSRSSSYTSYNVARENCASPSNTMQDTESISETRWLFSIV